MKYFILSILLLSIAGPVHAQSDQLFELPRLSSPITLDGMPDEKAWQEIPPLPLTMYQPVHMGQMSERSVIRVAYDDEYIYVSGELYDSEPDKIVANTMYRDRYSGDETFAIILDSFNDDETARWFFVTPTGVRVDQLVSKDSEGDGSINRNWTTHWDAATQITDEGWFVEMRIPFSSLGFRDFNGEVTMGMIAYRWIARKAERHIFPNIPPDWSRGFTKPSQAQKIRITGVEYSRPFYITPYVLSGFEQINQLSTDGSSYTRQTDYTAEAGLDIKFPVTGNMNLDITLNTDFAQVEADEAQVNLSRFPLFFPEKRQFFQERSDIFDFNLGGNNNLFYSRRIGLQQGQPIRIYGGARLAGRTGKWDVGVLNMQTEAFSELSLPSENYGVYRARRDIINRNSYAGGMLTTRLGMDGSYNIAAGTDLIYNYSGNHYVDVKYAATFDDRFEESFDPLTNGIIRLFLRKQTSSGFFYSFTAKRAGERYIPSMGFESRFNYTLLDGSLSYGYFNSVESPLRIVTPTARYFVSLRNEDNSVESMLFELPLSIDFKDGSSMRVTGNWWFEDLRNPLFFSNNTFVEPGSYYFYGVNFNYSMNSAKRLRTSLSAGLNTFYDGTQLSVGLSPTWNQSRYFEISGGIELNRLDFPDRDQREYLNVFRLRSLIALNTQVSLQLLTQYNYLSRQIGTNARFRYNFREGNDFWIVYSETSNTHTDHVTPALPRFDNRVVLVKYTYTFL
ncbi:MAG: hypothetical protein EA390_06600 [Balneolaceae bacterium]|nr:MAG: hypothetical protein EA390_06600 [Balneolaceae bacterium]